MAVRRIRTTACRSVQFKTANREFDPRRQDFHWVAGQRPIRSAITRPSAVVLERLENGDFYGFSAGVQTPERWTCLPARRRASDSMRRLGAIQRRRREVLDPLAARLSALSDQLDGSVMPTHATRLPEVAGGGRGPAARAPAPRWTPGGRSCRPDGEQIGRQSEELVAQQQDIEASLRRNVAVLADGQGRLRTIALADVVRFYQPNAMGLLAKVGHYLAKIWELLSAAPRESNTEGGLFPAIFGTVMLDLPHGPELLSPGRAGRHLPGRIRPEGFLVRLVRIAVNNLAGIPSIVYGIFGLGFFIYGLGAADQLVLSRGVAAGSPSSAPAASSGPA